MGTKISHLRREQLIEATISTIAKRGFSRTTLAHVAKEVKLSQGIVSFYFKSKEGLLLETLNYLAKQYYSAWEDALRRVGPDPVAALDALIELDLGPVFCERRKVSVWLAFWAESPGRPKYRSLCKEIEQADFEQTSKTCRQIVERGPYTDVDPDNVARGLNAMLIGYWLDVAKDPKGFDREKAKQACRQFLAGVFPTEFGTELHEKMLKGA